MAEDLDALCDLLEDSDDSFDEQIFNLVDEEVAKIEAVKSTTAEENHENNEQSKSVEKPKNEEKPKREETPKNGESTYVNEMEEKLKKMQEEMARMQKQLEVAKGVGSQPRKLEEIDVLQ